MGGKVWTLKEEKVFWTYIVPNSPKRLRAGKANEKQRWAELAVEMQNILGHDAKREYNGLMLFEHYFHNAMCNGKPYSPNAVKWAHSYRKAAGLLDSKELKADAEIKTQAAERKEKKRGAAHKKAAQRINQVLSDTKATASAETSIFSDEDDDDSEMIQKTEKTADLCDPTPPVPAVSADNGQAQTMTYSSYPTDERHCLSYLLAQEPSSGSFVQRGTPGYNPADKTAYETPVAMAGLKHQGCHSEQQTAAAGLQNKGSTGLIPQPLLSYYRPTKPQDQQQQQQQPQYQGFAGTYNAYRTDGLPIPFPSGSSVGDSNSSSATTSYSGISYTDVPYAHSGISSLASSWNSNMTWNTNAYDTTTTSGQATPFDDWVNVATPPVKNGSDQPEEYTGNYVWDDAHALAE